MQNNSFITRDKKLEAHSRTQFMLHCSHFIGRSMSNKSRNHDSALYRLNCVQASKLSPHVVHSILFSKQVATNNLPPASCSDVNQFC